MPRAILVGNTSNDRKLHQLLRTYYVLGGIDLGGIPARGA